MPTTSSSGTSTPRERLYFDNAATSFPKPPAVIEAMTRYANELGASPGRGAYREVVETARLLRQCRERLNRLFNGESADHVIFTLNATDALNLAIKGVARHYLRKGEPVHLVATHMDHNSVLRPYRALEADDSNVTVTFVQGDSATGHVTPDELRAAFTPHTRLVATLHGSNVTGTLQDVAAIGRMCREASVPLLVDAAQTLGHLPVDVRAMNIDLLAFPGHKGLLGPLGTGGLYLRPGMEKIVEPIREGGTGSRSEEDVQPDILPDRYEPGSHNAIGLIGLSEGVQWILDRGVDALWAHERRLMEIMLEAFVELPGLRLLGPQTMLGRCGVFSVIDDVLEPAELAAVLEDRFGILTRPGLHCAPHAHTLMDSAQFGGATRFSLGPFLTERDAEAAVEAVSEICLAHQNV